MINVNRETPLQTLTVENPTDKAVNAGRTRARPSRLYLGKMTTPKSTKKPSGSYDGYAANDSWVAEEYPRRLIITETWEDMKVLINKKPCPDDVAAIVTGVKIGDNTSLVMAALATANEKEWGVKMHRKPYAVQDTALLEKGVVVAFKETIDARMKEFLASSVKKDSGEQPRKRLRFEQEEGQEDSDTRGGTYAAPAWGDDNDDDDCDNDDVDKPSMLSSPHGKNDMDGPFSPLEPTGGDEGGDDEFRAEMRAEMQKEMQKMKTQFEELKAEVLMLRSAVFDPCSIAIYNISKVRNENPTLLMKKVTSILTDLGFVNEAKNMTAVERFGACTVRIRFGDPRAVDKIIGNTALFHPETWGTKSGGAAKVAAMTTMRGEMLKMAAASNTRAPTRRRRW